MALRPMRTVITLTESDVVQLQELLIDEDSEGALVFLREVIGEKARCAQTESHRPEFEGGTGKEGSHYLQKGEGHPKPPGA